MLIEAAAANNAAPDGKNIERNDSIGMDPTKGKSSVLAALAAAQSPARAEVKGKIDPARAP